MLANAANRIFVSFFVLNWEQNQKDVVIWNLFCAPLQDSDQYNHMKNETEKKFPGRFFCPYLIDILHTFPDDLAMVPETGSVVFLLPDGKKYVIGF